MSLRLSIHPQNPQTRQLAKLAKALREGALIAYPTDTCYALACMIGDKQGMERIRRIRRLDAKHQFTLVCRDLSEIALYAKVDNWAYRLLKSHTPGPFTFILKATHGVPRRLQVPKRKTIGVRVPDHCIVRALLEELNVAIISSTLSLPGMDNPLSDPDEIEAHLDEFVDVIVDGGSGGLMATTVVDLSSGEARVTRQGKGIVDWVDR